MIPCYIQNRDTLAVRAMIEKLWECEQALPIIVDCGSTFPPLLDWLREAERNGTSVVRVDPAHHNKAAWAVPAAARPAEPLGVYMASDGDLDITGLPRDFLLVMREQLLERADLVKVGCALEVVDLPAACPVALDAARHEAQFWMTEDRLCLLRGYRADIDTTLALYRSGQGWGGYGPSLRIAGPYTVRHIPWYLTWENITPDWLWYFEHLEVLHGLGWTPRLREIFRG